MKNKTYITNLWYHLQNYGAILTAYALQKILEDLGIQNQLLDFSFSKNSQKKAFGFNFAKKHIKSEYCKISYSDLHKLNDKADIFIAGSDQIFRNGGDAPSWLDFVDYNKKKIAFSASFGVDKEKFLQENSNEQIEQIKQSLKGFDFVSVREKTGVDICNNILNINAEWIIDPVFILDKSKYDELIEESDIDYNDKIVAYILDTNKEYKESYKYLKNFYNKKIVEIANSNISVQNWLASIRDCDLFVTDSFHGMCFAIIFNKPFICIANKTRGCTRFDSICEMLGVENQCIDSITDVVHRDCIFNINYKQVNERIEEEKQKGKKFLINAINSEKIITKDKLLSKIAYLDNKIMKLEKQIQIYPAVKLFLWGIWKRFFYNFIPIKIQKRILEYRVFKK